MKTNYNIMDITYLLMGLFSLHFIGDFVFQTRQMAEIKSKSVFWLSLHVLWYCFAFFPVAFGIGFDTPYVEFMFLLFTTHWLTDFITSKITTYFWKKKKIKAFFTTIGFDQLIHIATLLLLFKYFIQPFVFI